MGRLDVRICGARNLYNPDFIGKPDPYVTLNLENQSHRTSAKKDTLNPQWDEVFKFQVADENSAQLVMKIYNDCVGRDDFLGEYCLSISGMAQGQVIDEWLLLKNARSGELHVRVQALDFGRPSQAGGYPPQQGYPQQGGYPGQAPPQGYPPQQGGYPGQPGYGAPPQGYPPQQPGYPPQQGGYPGQQPGYPPQQGGYPGQQPGYPPQQGGYPGQQPGYPPQQQGGYPGQQGGYPGQGYPGQQGGYPGGSYPGQQGSGSFPPQGGHHHHHKHQGSHLFHNGDNGEVLLLLDGGLRHVPNEQVFFKLFTFSSINPGEMTQFRGYHPEFQKIHPLPYNARLIQPAGRPEVYLIDSNNGQEVKRHIRNEQAMHKYHFSFQKVEQADPYYVNSIPDGYHIE